MNLTTKKKYPKILIIENTFNKNTSTGITLSNLFFGWPQNKIAVVSSSIDLNDTDQLSLSETYYQLGHKEIEYLGPIKFIKKVNASRIIAKNEFRISEKEKISEENIYNKDKYRKIYNLFFKEFIYFTGLSNIRIKYSVSDELLNWINKIEPDIIFSALGNLSMIRFVNSIYEKTKIPLVLYILDDWPKSLVRNWPFNVFWNNAVHSEFKNLLEKSSRLLSICQEMSIEYKKRYNRDFIPFHNPVDSNKWGIKNNKLTSENSNNIKFIYVGKINKDTKSPLLNMCKAINALYKKGFKIIFEIYALNKDNKFKSRVNKYETVKIKPPISHKNIPNLLINANILFLPLDFNKKSIRYTKFSMPTKVSEYMISGTPILLYAPDSIAITKYLRKNDCAFIVDNKNNLAMELEKLLRDSEKRTQVANKARKLALNTLESKIVRQKFLNALTLDKC